MITIIILALIAVFLGLRLYSVLGRRAEHEEESIPTRFDSLKDKADPSRTQLRPVPAPEQRQLEQTGQPVAVERGIREIAAADRSFDFTAFLEGAKGAYAMVLEAFWSGDRGTLRELCDDDVYNSFDAAITAREDAGETVDNKLIRIEEQRVQSARLEGSRAFIAVAFTADIAAITRDKDGNIISGSLDDAIESRDIWTFSRDVSSADPHWLLVETDQA